MNPETIKTLPTSLDDGTCVKRGLCPIVDDDRLMISSPNPRQIYYEIHGNLEASQKLVLIMGFNFTCSGWSEQVKHWSQKSDHAVLVFDNRGTGNSHAGSMEPYKTSDMAKDTLALLDWLGWDQDRSLHLFGISLGGMIAQELCLLVPERFKSLSLISTRCGSTFYIGSTKIMNAMLKTLTKMVPQERELDLYLDTLFPQAHIDDTTEEGRVRKSVLREHLRNCHFLPRQQSVSCFLSQFAAVTFHHCSYERLNKIARDLHPAKILVITGDSDELIVPQCSVELHEHLPGSELIIIKDAGHALIYQISEEFNRIMDRIIQEGNQAFQVVSN